MDDALGIAEVHVASWRSAYRGLIEQNVLDYLSVSKRAQSWSRVLSQIAAPNRSSTCELEPHRILVADVDERIVGWASFGAGRDEGVSNQGEIAGLYVHPDFWRTKVGHSLLGSAELHLSDAGFSSAYLWVLFGNQRELLTRPCETPAQKMGSQRNKSQLKRSKFSEPVICAKWETSRFPSLRFAELDGLG